MKITDTTVYSGPSIYARCPAVRCTLAGLEQGPARFDQALLEDLLQGLPGLAAHWGSCRVEDGVESARVAVNHLFEHVCIELQRLAGCEVGCIRMGSARQIGPGEAVVAFEDPDVGVEAARLALGLMGSLLPADLPSATGEARRFDLGRSLERFLRFAERAMLPVQDRELVRRARARDVPVSRLVGRVLQLGQGRYQQRMSATKTTRTNVVSNDLAANKDYARRILLDLGLPVPRYERVYRLRDAVEAARRIGYPVVVKPNNGSMGEGVSVGMKSRRQVRGAYKRALAYGRSVLIEEMVEGSDYRLLVVGGELVAASQRVPGHVVGDGAHSVEQLVEQVNSDPRRGTGPLHSWTRIELDEQADRLLTELGYTRSSVPADGEVVYLRRNANTSDGGTAVDVTDDVHPDNRDIAMRAARAIGLDVAGVDFLTTDISSSMWENGGRICEINSRPGLRKHIWPAAGTPRDVTTPIVDMLFPPGRRSRVATVAITGTGETADAAHRLAHLLAAEGRHVGLAAERRVHIDGRRTGPARLTAPAAARMILLDPNVDVAVLEIAPEDVLTHGLGCDAFDVALVVNAPQADAAEDPEATCEAIRLVTRTTRGVVLIAGDPECGRAQTRESGEADVCPLVTTAREADSIVGLGRLMVFDGQALGVYQQGELRAQIPVSSRPEGGDGPGGLRSTLYAVAAAHALGMAPEEIQRGLASLEPPVRKSA